LFLLFPLLLHHLEDLVPVVGLLALEDLVLVVGLLVLEDLVLVVGLLALEDLVLVVGKNNFYSKETAYAVSF
jgi:hypothetical protein